MTADDIPCLRVGLMPFIMQSEKKTRKDRSKAEKPISGEEK